jgi:hypothetical protein
MSGLHLGVGLWSKWGFGHWVLQTMQSVMHAAEDNVSGGAIRQLKFAGKPG